MTGAPAERCYIHAVDRVILRDEVSKTFKRAAFGVLLSRLREPRRFIQVLGGPRQTGKTTLARQVLSALDLPARFASADEPVVRDRAWLIGEWELGRRLAVSPAGAVLVLDEIQKLPGWSETVKRMWDEDTAAAVPLRVVLLGSAPLLVQRGLTESLAGRFELIRVWHWGYAEMREAFGWDVDRYVYFGGYPGAASLIEDEERWRAYMNDALIETTISRDVLLLNAIEKPALLRQLFGLACELSGQIVSYTKLMGQLTDAGNTSTLTRYLELLGGAGMVTGLQRYSGSRIRQRGSIPKLLALNTGLMSAVNARGLGTAREDPQYWGRLVETAVGAHLMGDRSIEVLYWREGDREVDYVVRRGRAVLGIEVASGRPKRDVRGMQAFLRRHGRVRPLLVGEGGMSVEDLLLSEPRSLLS